MTSMRGSFPERKSWRCRNNVATMSSWVLSQKETNGTLWNVMGPAQNRDGREDGRHRNGSWEEQGGLEVRDNDTPRNAHKSSARMDPKSSSPNHINT